MNLSVNERQHLCMRNKNTSNYAIIHLYTNLTHIFPNDKSLYQIEVAAFLAWKPAPEHEWTMQWHMKNAGVYDLYPIMGAFMM